LTSARAAGSRAAAPHAQSSSRLQEEASLLKKETKNFSGFRPILPGMSLPEPNASRTKVFLFLPLQKKKNLSARVVLPSRLIRARFMAQ
jgi:hypothetical protein